MASLVDDITIKMRRDGLATIANRLSESYGALAVAIDDMYAAYGVKSADLAEVGDPAADILRDACETAACLSGVRRRVIIGVEALTRMLSERGSTGGA